MADVVTSKGGLSAGEGPVGGFSAVVYTDIDGSTGLWERHPDLMPAALARHNRLIESMVVTAGGTIVKNLGDGFLAVFDDAEMALVAATRIEDELGGVDWDLDGDTVSVRVAIDLGEIERRDGDIAGPAVNRCSRILDIAHGGQIIVSDEVAERTHPDDVTFVDLGEFPLRGVEFPVGLHRVEPIELPLRREPAVRESVSPTGVRSTMRGFELRERIGTGVAGVVYRAHQRSVDREVAIKLIRPEYANDRRFIRRFETEAQFIARLEHPHIVSLYDYWRDPDGAYLVMRWLRGGSVRQSLGRGPWNEASTVQLLQQVGTALAYAHRHGVIHRDVRPSNVLLDEEGNGYLSDFGIASRPITEGGISASTSPEYRSPEETDGGPLTEATDQYCLGLLAHELITGQRPVHPHIVDLPPDVDPSLGRAIARATAADPTDRFPDMESFVAALSPTEETVETVEVSRDPFKGLRPFLEADAADFAGRDTLVDRLVQAVARHRLVAAVGASGSGKSSAVRAGLVPALRRGAIPGSNDWLIADLYPGAHPFDELAVALLGVATQPLPDLARDLAGDSTALLWAVKQIVPDGSELVIVIDQFEELFTLCDQPIQQAFVEALVELVSDPRARARIVVTLRADFYDRPLAFSRLAPLLDQGLVTVGAPTAEELAQAITQPSENVGLIVEPSLVELIVGQVVDQPGGLPLLQYTLSELFQRRDHNRLTIDAFHDIGGVTGALASRAEALYTDLDSEARSATEQVFLRLVSIDDTGEPTRRRLLRSDLDSAAATRQVLAAYGTSRLLTFDHDPVSRDPTVEVAHEALLHRWPRLADWIDERRDDLATHRRFTLALTEWDNRNRDSAYLPTGPRLAHFETWAGDTHFTLTEPERQFLTQSRAEENRLQTRRQRVRRLITAGFGIIALVAVVFALFAVVQRDRAEENRIAAEQAAEEADEARREAERQKDIADEQAKLAEEKAAEALRAEDLARSRELAAAAIATIDEDPQLSILLALEAIDMAEPPPASIEALHQAVQSQQLIHEINTAGPFWPDWSLHPDGRHLAITNDAISVEVIDIESDSIVSTYSIPESSLLELAGSTPAKNRALESEGQPTPEADCRNIFGVMSMQAVAFSPNGSLVATVLGDGRLHVFDAFTGTPVDLGTPQFIQAFDEYCYPYATVDFTPDGTGVIVAVRSIDDLRWPDYYQHTQIWAVDESGLIADIPKVYAGSSFEVSDDGRWAVTAGFWARGITVDDLTGEQERKEFRTGSEVVFDSLFVPAGTPVAGEISDGPRVIIARRYNTAQVWDIETGRQTGWFEGPETTLDVSETGTLVGAGFDGTVYVWDLASGLPTATLTGHEGTVWDVEISADGQTVASGPDNEGRIKIWDLGGVSQAEVAGTIVPNRQTSVRLDVADGVVAVLTRDDATFTGSLVIYDPISWDTRAEVLDRTGRGFRLVPSTGEVVSQEGVLGEGWTPIETDMTVRSLDTPDETKLRLPLNATCDRFYETGQPEPWCAGVPEPEEEFWLFTYDVDVSPDGNLIAVAGQSSTTVWDGSTGQLITGWSLDLGYHNGVRFSPDGHYLVSGAGSTAQIHRVGEWDTPYTVLDGFAYTVQYMDFSPDGSLLAIQASETNQVTVWNTDTWELEYAIQEHQGGVTDLDFSSDGRRLVTVGMDGTARVFDASNGEAEFIVRTPGEGERFVRFAPWTPDHLIVAAGNGLVSVLTLDAEELGEIARDKLFRDFTPSECERFALEMCDDGS